MNWEQLLLLQYLGEEIFRFEHPLLENRESTGLVGWSVITSHWCVFTPTVTIRVPEGEGRGGEGEGGEERKKRRCNKNQVHPVAVSFPESGKELHQ